MKRIFSTVFIVCVAFAAVFQASAQIAQSDSTAVPASVAPESVVSRLQQAGSSITVTAPEQLLLRAAAASDSTAEAAETTETLEEQEATEENATRVKSGKAVGYRVQIYADNNVRTAKTEARQRERMVGGSFPQWDTYVTYASPYWRLRVGDFRTQYDAEKAAGEIRKAFPRYAKEVRVVRDRVNVR